MSISTASLMKASVRFSRSPLIRLSDDMMPYVLDEMVLTARKAKIAIDRLTEKQLQEAVHTAREAVIADVSGELKEVLGEEVPQEPTISGECLADVDEDKRIIDSREDESASMLAEHVAEAEVHIADMEADAALQDSMMNGECPAPAAVSYPTMKAALADIAPNLNPKKAKAKKTVKQIHTSHDHCTHVSTKVARAACRRARARAAQV